MSWSASGGWRDQVGGVEHYADQPGVVAELVQQAAGRVGVGHDVARFGLDPEAHAGAASAAGNNVPRLARSSAQASGEELAG